jgi:hypothetical protein
MSKAEDPEYCETPCNGPIMGFSRTHLAIGHMAYWLWMMLPYRIAFGWLGMQLLPRAGEIAHLCSCSDKNHAARSRKADQ